MVGNRVLERFMNKQVSLRLLSGEGYTGTILDVDGDFILFQHGSQELLLSARTLASCYPASEYFLAVR